MRNNTQRIYERLSRGEFLSVDSADASVRHLYEDIEENLEDYTEYFKEIGLQLESDNGYFYFSRIGEGKQTIEQKLDSFSKWLDYLDFLKCYNWKSHATLTLLATQDLPTFGYNMIDPLKSWCWGSILFYPFKISRFS